MHSAGVCYGG